MMTRFYAVDRIEGGKAVLVDDRGSVRDVALADLPFGLREGMVLRVGLTGRRPEWSSALIDDEERRRREEDARRTLEALRERDPGGDVAL